LAKGRDSEGRPVNTHALAARNVDDVRRLWLDHYAERGNIELASRHARVSRLKVAKWRKDSREHPEDPANQVDWNGEICVPFHEAAEQAQQMSIDALEEECRKRAVEGEERVERYQGKVVGTYREKSDRLLEILLRAKRPREFGASVKVEADVAVHHELTESARDLLAQKLMLAAERLNAAKQIEAPSIDAEVVNAETVEKEPTS
jgi:hypothetical protein